MRSKRGFDLETRQTAGPQLTCKPQPTANGTTLFKIRWTQRKKLPNSIPCWNRYLGRQTTPEKYLPAAVNAILLQSRPLSGCEKVIYVAFYLAEGAPFSWSRTVELEIASSMTKHPSTRLHKPHFQNYGQCRPSPQGAQNERGFRMCHVHQ